MSTKISKNGCRQRIPGKAAALMKQQGSRADQAQGGQCRAQAKEESSHGWEGPRGLAGLQERAGPDVQVPQDGQKEGKMSWEGGARAGFYGDHWQTVCRKFKLVHQSAGTAQTCQQMCWSCSSGGGWGSLGRSLLREGKETRESPAAAAQSCSVVRWPQISVPLTSTSSS